MSQRKKAPKKSGRPAGERTCRWVAKAPRKEAKDERSGVTLEKFRSEWLPLPDMASASSTDYYFNSYAHFGIHEDMLKDQVRTGSYLKAIANSKHLFAGKTVLDVGSGTGILCLFAAKAGARRCIGIECSDIADFASQIAQDNGFGDVITYVRGKVEEVELPVEQVDIIISEWMGYFLIYESMLDSVLFARDKWLVPGANTRGSDTMSMEPDAKHFSCPTRPKSIQAIETGKLSQRGSFSLMVWALVIGWTLLQLFRQLFPDHARLYMAAIEDADYKEEKIGFWSHVWGFDFSPMQQLAMQEPISDTVEETAIATDVACILELDLRTCGREELDFLSSYSLQVQRKDFLHALVVWFDVTFRASSPPVVLSTAPGKAATHWKQTVLYLEEAVVAETGDKLFGMIAVRKTLRNPRDLDVKVSFNFTGKVKHAPKVQYYRLR